MKHRRLKIGPRAGLRLWNTPYIESVVKENKNMDTCQITAGREVWVFTFLGCLLHILKNK